MEDRSETIVGIVPIGMVASPWLERKQVPLWGSPAAIDIFPEYRDALLGLDQYSHIWVVSWFHLASRNTLRNLPRRVCASLPECGVFALRTPGRPNPIALSLVRLDGVQDCRIQVQGMDAVNGTPILDIKPYNAYDSVFSPIGPWFCLDTEEHRRADMVRRALAHHQEECPWLSVAVDMALAAEDILGDLQNPALVLDVHGPPCLADVLQGLTRARLANPPRFSFTPDAHGVEITWTRGTRVAIWGPVPLDVALLAGGCTNLRLREGVA